MHLRSLVLEDALKMLEWLQDKETTEQLAIGRYPISQENAEDFIRKSWGDKNNVHFAISDNSDQYYGTISLKNIDYVNRNAEYAIVVCKEYWGTGIAKEATAKIIEYGFNELNLKKIYLNVLESNKRANNFYKKMGFVIEGHFESHFYKSGKYENLVWYAFHR